MATLYLSGERRSRLLGMIVGFEIGITDIRAKFKLSKNRSVEDQRRVSQELGGSTSQTVSAVAELMQWNGRAELK
jgi:transcriptional regulator